MGLPHLGKKDVTRHSGKTVYILGAGFSKEMGMPLLRDFIPEALSLIKNRKNTALSKRVEDLLRRYRHAEAYLGRPLFNLEDLFCLVDLDSYRGNQDNRSTLIEFIYEAIRIAHENHKEQISTGVFAQLKSHRIPAVPRGCIQNEDIYTGNPLNETFNVCAYEAFLSLVIAGSSPGKGESNAIITLNYDLLLEKTLFTAFKNIGIYYGFKINQRSSLDFFENRFVSERNKSKETIKSIPIYKLHGSLNWQAANTDGALNPDPTKMQVWCPDWFVHLCGETKETKKFYRKLNETERIKKIPLVPPTWRKSGAENTVYGILMREALSELQTASQIVIIGYSMPITDAYFKYLLVEAFSNPPLPKVSVWDIIPEENYKRKASEMFGTMIADHISYNKGGFVGYVLNANGF